MGLDVYTYFFYGIPFGEHMRVIRERDTENGLRRCPKCDGVMSSEFCPSDGAATSIIKSGPGEKVLYDMKSVEPITLDGEDDDTAYLAVKVSVKRVNKMRGRESNAIKLGTELRPDPKWNEALAEACRKLEVEFAAAEAGFFCGTRMSY